MFFVKYFCAALILDLGKYAAVSAQSTVGKKCVLKSGRGTCRIYEQCKIVYNDIKPPEILCGYEDGLPVVCCPNSEKHSVLQKITLPISDRPSDKYYAALLAQWEDPQEDSYAVGKKCVLKSGRGTCRFFEHCKTVYNDNKPPELMCGYQDGLPVVCCPNKDVFQEKETLPIRKRPAEEACLRYSQEEPALRKMGSPVILGGKVAQDYLDKKCHPPPARRRTYIVGGERAAPREFPHMTAIGFGPDESISWKCGGTLISEDFILTAAHCLSSTLGSPTWVRMGDLVLNSTKDDARPQNRRIAKMIRHSDYTPRLNYHDIALLKLESPVTFDAYVRPACLSLVKNLSETEFPPPVAFATGWGLTDDDEDAGTPDLMKVQLPIVPIANCTYRYTSYNDKLPNGIDDKTQVCAGGSNGKDTCQGDSGGPLSIRNKQPCIFDIFGITSFGPSCGSVIPAVYTRVYNYLPWIESIVWPNLN